MQEKYGFVYIWRDKGKNRYYIGCHWGREDDGYICSSNWMRNSYKRRHDDFRRRILKRIYTNREDLLDEEYRWLSLIPEEELGNRYYNHHHIRFSRQAKENIGKRKRGRRKEALEKGLKTYFSENPCKYCGTFEKYVSTYGCKYCVIERGLKKLNDSILMQQYRTPEKKNRYTKKWRKANPDKVKIYYNKKKERRSVMKILLISDSHWGN